MWFFTYTRTQVCLWNCDRVFTCQIYFRSCMAMRKQICKYVWLLSIAGFRLPYHIAASYWLQQIFTWLNLLYFMQTVCCIKQIRWKFALFSASPFSPLIIPDDNFLLFIIMSHRVIPFFSFFIFHTRFLVNCG